MKRTIGACFVIVCMVSTVSAAPITPSIDAYLINFATDLTYDTAGSGSDTLVSTDDGSGGEATAFWPAWPTPGAPTPINYSMPAFSMFGGEVEMGVKFTGSDFDASFLPFPQVSLIGTGLTGEGIGDFKITGRLDTLFGVPNEVLWDIDIAFATLYGYAGFGTYTFEALGTILGGKIADEQQIPEGSQAVIRGFVQLDELAFDEGYSPTDMGLGSSGGVIAGQTGLGEVPPGASVPEPSTLAMLLAGTAALGLGLIRRRGTKRA